MQKLEHLCWILMQRFYPATSIFSTQTSLFGSIMHENYVQSP